MYSQGHTAARSYPADVTLQRFYTEHFDREVDSRAKFGQENKRSRAGGYSKTSWVNGISGNFGISARPNSEQVLMGVTQMNPMQFALAKKKREDAELAQLRREVRAGIHMVEMWAPPPRVRDTLYDGFTEEEKGRHQYLRNRHRIIPEEKYTLPMLSSWNHGWKLHETATYQNPRHARNRLLQDSFYTRNGVPDLHWRGSDIGGKPLEEISKASVRPNWYDCCILK